MLNIYECFNLICCFGFVNWHVTYKEQEIITIYELLMTLSPKCIILKQNSVTEIRIA